MRYLTLVHFGSGSGQRLSRMKEELAAVSVSPNPIA